MSLIICINLIIHQATIIIVNVLKRRSVNYEKDIIFNHADDHYTFDWV